MNLESLPNPEKIRMQELKDHLETLLHGESMDAVVEYVERMAYRDPLTGILNRRGFLHEAGILFQKVGESSADHGDRKGLPMHFNALLLDIDHFKKINDTYGHDAGDAALKKVAEVLTHALRAGDTVGRWGGEEFVITFVTAQRIQKMFVAEKLRKALEDIEFIYEGQRIPLTASFGVAEYHGTGGLPELISRADEAMYRAKQSGRNRIAVSEE